MSDPDIHGEMEHVVLDMKTRRQVVTEVVTSAIVNEAYRADGDCWKHDFEELYICKNCGVAEERV